MPETIFASALADSMSARAAAAWRCLNCAGGSLPTEVNVVERGIYKLRGAGPDGESVIAKHRGYRPNTGLDVERIIYERILGKVGVPAPRYYGFVRDSGEKSAWLFIEEIEGEEYQVADRTHRAAAARWLAVLHSAAANHVVLSDLPDRGPNHYLAHLEALLTTITANADKPWLSNATAALLSSIAFHCELLKEAWSSIAAVCDPVPVTFVHGDFVGKNLRVRPGPDGPELVAFDWATSGRGVLCPDLCHGSTRKFAAKPDLEVYLTRVRDWWPELRTRELQLYSSVGELFRVLAAARWAAESFASEHPDRVVSYMRLYEEQLSELRLLLRL